MLLGNVPPFGWKGFVYLHQIEATARIAVKRNSIRCLRSAISLRSLFCREQRGKQ